MSATLDAAVKALGDADKEYERISKQEEQLKADLEQVQLERRKALFQVDSAAQTLKMVARSEYVANKM